MIAQDFARVRVLVRVLGSLTAGRARGYPSQEDSSARGYPSQEDSGSIAMPYG